MKRALPCFPLLLILQACQPTHPIPIVSPPTPLPPLQRLGNSPFYLPGTAPLPPCQALIHWQRLHPSSSTNFDCAYFWNDTPLGHSEAGQKALVLQLEKLPPNSWIAIEPSSPPSPSASESQNFHPFLSDPELFAPLAQKNNLHFLLLPPAYVAQFAPATQPRATTQSPPKPPKGVPPPN